MKNKKKLGLIIDLLMYLVMIVQMLYVFTGNNVHEWLGISFFILLLCHLYIKRTWFSLWTKRSGKWISARRFADLIILLLLLNLLLLSLSSMGVSRLLFPNIHFLASPQLHTILATLALCLACIHGGMHVYFKNKNKKKVVIIIVLSCIASLGLGFGLVPYMNRHFRLVDVNQETNAIKEKLHWKGEKPLVVYFTRVGNTNFDADIDAVSSASLLRVNGELTGNTQFISSCLKGLINCDIASIQLTDSTYPSSYAETCSVGGKEIKEQARPKIQNIDVSAYQNIILVYPIWWGTIPMPVASFLESGSFEGKNIYLVATQGSHGFASSTNDIRALVPTANIIEGISVYCEDIPISANLLTDWLKDTGLAQ